MSCLIIPWFAHQKLNPKLLRGNDQFRNPVFQRGFILGKMWIAVLITQGRHKTHPCFSFYFLPHISLLLDYYTLLYILDSVFDF